MVALLSGFFSNKTQGHKPREEYRFINVGNEQFHAAAVALIDSLSSMQRGYDAILKKILGRFGDYFPRHVSSQPFLTLPERMDILLHNTRKSELVECMAYVVRQLTVDELYIHPLNYREVFNGLSAETPKSYLRDPQVKLPPSALNALAQALGVTVTLSFKEPGKELGKKEVYDGVMSKINLMIQIQGDQYFPAVKNKTDFAYVGQLAINAPRPADDKKEQDETLADIIHLIEQDNKELLQSYAQWRKAISSMLGAGELTFRQLIKLYITFLPAQSSSLSALVAKLRAEPVIADFPVEKELYTSELLASALASWISTKQVEPNSLFDQIENPSATVVS